MKRILFKHEDILVRVNQLAQFVNLDLIIKQEMDRPILLCVLDGGFRFYSDLVSRITSPILCDFIKISSYDNKNQSDIKIHKFPKYPIRGNDIIIIDDIYDSGNTIGFLLNELELRNPNSISIITLLHRKGKEYITKYPHHSGFEIDDEWVAGYGLDDVDGTGRNKNYIYEVEKLEG